MLAKVAVHTCTLSAASHKPTSSNGITSKIITKISINSLRVRRYRTITAPSSNGRTYTEILHNKRPYACMHIMSLLVCLMITSDMLELYNYYAHAVQR